MSRQNHGRNLTEWADLIGASLPDSVAERDDVRTEFYAEDGFSGGLSETIRNRGGTDFTAGTDESE